MKLRQFRNPSIRQRLKEAATSWQAITRRSFKSAPKATLSSILLKLSFGLLFGIILLFLWFSKEDGPIFLSVFLPAIAILVFLKTARIRAIPDTHETIQLLPLDNATLSRQIRHGIRKPIVLGIIFSAILGFFGAHETISLTGALQALLIFLGLLGFLTIAYLWKFFQILTVLVKASGALLFAAMVMDSLRAIGTTVIQATPWFQAFSSPLILASFVIVGASVAFFTKDRWSKVTRYDRSHFFEANGRDSRLQNDTEHQEDVLTLSTLPNSSKTPSGLLEKFTWRSLDLKEKALLRAAGSTDFTFLSNWAKVSALFFLALWLTRFSWPAAIDTFRFVTPLFALFAGISRYPIIGSTPAHYLQAVTLGSSTPAARFQVLPLSITTLEKLMWKESLLRWLLMSLTLAAAPFFIPSYSCGPLSIVAFIIIAFSFFIHVFSLQFWNAAITGWTARRGRAALWAFLIQALLIIGILLAPVFGFIYLFALKDFDKSSSLTTNLSIFTLVIAIYHLSLRALIRAFIADKRADLLRQN
ncbi:MAG: hypothetical protein ACI9NQ_000484 [Paracoccaceae bacterium]|jgi:hypothetical protein